MVVHRMASTPLKGMVTGMLLTALVQSSSAITAITVGLAAGRLITFTGAVGVVLGTNIGTTVTAQLAAFDIVILAPYLITAGLVIVVAGGHPARLAGIALSGSGLFFQGLLWIHDGLSSLASGPFLPSLLRMASGHPLLAVAAGVLGSTAVQSSSVVIALAILLTRQELLTLPAATAIVLGANVGTCSTALLAAMGSNIAARRVALVHLVLNAGGVLLVLPFLTFFTQLVSLSAADPGRQVANAHTLFNVISSLAVLPWAGGFARLVALLVPEGNKRN